MNGSFVTYLRVLCVAAAFAAGGISVHSAEPQWETLRTEQSSEPGDTDRLDVVVRSGYLYVTVSRPTPVKIFTILGQLVSQRNLPAGTSRLRLKGRGMYILKTDLATRRVTV